MVVMITWLCWTTLQTKTIARSIFFFFFKRLHFFWGGYIVFCCKVYVICDLSYGMSTLFICNYRLLFIYYLSDIFLFYQMQVYIMAGAHGGKGGARSGNNGARGGKGGSPSGNGGARGGKGGAYGGKGGSPSGNGGARKGNDGSRSDNDGAHSGNAGTRGRTPKPGFRPPSRQAHDFTDDENIDDGTFMTTCGRYSTLRGGHAGNILAVHVRGNEGSGSRGGHAGSGSRGGHDGSGSRGGHGGSGRRGGHAGSSSRGGAGDPMADMCGVIRDSSLRAIPDRASNHYSEESDFADVDRQDADHEDDDRQDADHEDDDRPLSQRSYEGASGDTFQGRVIRRAGETFEVEHGDVHKSITRILSQHHDGAWMTFRQIPRDKLARMFECFRTRWSWDPANEQLIHDGFINVLKKRYRDIMRQLRIDSIMLACAVHEDMDPTNYLQFDKIRDFPPPAISLEVWRELCKRWNTKGWLNMSKNGSKNRRSADSSGKSLRHTGGSMGYAERRARMIILYTC
ncbi:hypothetical protein Hanom_Chr09g00845091 [Helianthus anomalus]